MESSLAFLKALQTCFSSKTVFTSPPWSSHLLLFTLLKPMSLPAVLINSLLCALRSMPLQMLFHKPLTLQEGR